MQQHHKTPRIARTNMTDNEKIEEAVRLVNEGMKVTLAVRGNSMLPFIIGGRDSVVLEKPEGISEGDIVLAWCDSNYYVIHRIINIDDNKVILMGDGNVIGKEHCLLSDVKAKATHVVRGNGKPPKPLYTKRMRLMTKLWKTAIPVRRYILFVIRIITSEKYKL